MRRSEDRLKEIDTFLTDNYPTNGSNYCASALGEDIKYIQSRVQRLNLYMDTAKNRNRTNKKASKVRELQGKLTARNREIEHLWELLRKQRHLNSELRLENIRLITEKVKRNKKQKDGE